MKRIVLMGALSLALAGCSGHHSASKSAFKDVLQDYADKHPTCLPMSLQGGGFDDAGNLVEGRVGDPYVKIALKDAQGEDASKEALKQMDILLDADIYDKDGTEKRPGMWKPGAEIPVKVFRLTDKGSRQFMIAGGVRQLCVGHESIKKVDWFTTPASSNGLMMSQVAYRGRYKLERWAKDWLKANPNALQASLPEEFDAKAVLVQTNDGWRDVRELH